MAYKDKDKQREANRQASKKYRDSMTGKGMTVADEPSNVIPKSDIRVIPSAPPILEPKVKRGKDIKSFEDLSPSIQRVIDMMSTTDGKLDQTIKTNRTAIAVHYQHLFPDKYYSQDAVISGPAVTGKPGDADYNGVCTEAWRAERGR